MNRYQNPYKNAWEELCSRTQEPSFLTGITEVSYNDFAKRTYEAKPDFIKETTQKLYSGNVFLLKGALDNETCANIIENTYNFFQNYPSEFHKMLDGCPNFHRVQDEETSLLYSTRQIRDAYYSFRWNDDTIGVWNSVTPLGRTIKYLSGLEKDAYETNLPSDGVIDRIQVLRYPPGGGGISLHTDSGKNQRVIAGIMLTKRGMHYQEGGYYIAKTEDEIFDFEEYVDVGDIVVFYPSLRHGVAEIDPGESVNWKNRDGRWYMALFSPDTDHVKERATSRHLG
ncbi:MAG: hypothetical protein CMM58_00410 [Rhodospirillaceae bacterium]|nr:hypothetical protein [Rhodospirillaceae bacterium]|tara:strand:+ start:721 stop:1569 length:849 start_codon:yes stop_codon:yes gene_type:complete